MKSRSKINSSPVSSKRNATATREITPVSYIRIKFVQYNAEESFRESPPKLFGLAQEREIVVNINCPIRLLMEYVRVEANIPFTIDFDLFDEMGNLKHTFGAPVEQMATKIFIPKGVYFIALLPRSDLGTMLKPIILINRGARVNGDYTTRIRRQLQQSARKSAKI